MFFTESIITKFINSKSTDKSKSVSSLIDEGEIITLSRLTDLLYASRYYTRFSALNQSKEDFLKDQKNQFIKHFSKIVCGDAIGLGYGQDTMRGVIRQKSNDFDIAIIFKKKVDIIFKFQELPEDYEDEGEFNDSQTTVFSNLTQMSQMSQLSQLDKEEYIPPQERFDEIKPDPEYLPPPGKRRRAEEQDYNFFKDKMVDAVSFIVVEKGECKTYPEAYSINLICAKPGGWGQIMMALYLYTIANNKTIKDKKGILELANAYLNPAGVCMYSKFGFVYDSSLFGEYCFPDFNNLPMIINNINSQKTIDILLGIDSYPKPFICSISDKPLQIFVGACMNLERFIKFNEQTYIDDVMLLADGTEIYYKKIFDVIPRRELFNFIKDVELKKITNIPPNYQQLYKDAIIFPKRLRMGGRITRKRGIKQKNKNKYFTKRKKTNKIRRSNKRRR